MNERDQHTHLARLTMVRLRLYCSSLLLVTGLVVHGLAHGDPAPLTQDTYVNGNGGQATKINGSKSFIVVETSSPQLGLIQFDLTALGGTVLSATLTLNVTQADIPGDVDIHEVQGAWIESAVNYNERPPLNGVPEASLPVTVGDVGGTVSVDITSLAQSWVNTPAMNYGLALLPGSVNARFASKEGGMGATLDVVTDGGAPPPPPPPAGEELLISGVFVDFGTNLITITGEHFDNGAVPEVVLGDFLPLSSIALSDSIIEATLPGFVTDGDYLLVVNTGPADAQSAQYDLTIDAGLTEAEVDAFVSNNGFSTGPHTIDTIRSDAEILGVVGPHTVDTDTTRSDAEILGVAGPHTVDTDTQLNEAQVDAFVANNNFSTGPHTLVSFDINNTAGGVNALASNTSGQGLTGLGFDALRANTFGNFNTASGLRALRNNIGGSFNTAIGVQALFNNVNGFYNTASGYQALFGNTTGNHNTAIGRLALKDNSTGIRNTGTGDQALLANMTGSNNTASGFAALIRNTTGHFNTATGVQTLVNNTSGSSNTANGYSSLAGNISGINNTATGYRALLRNDGSNNIAVGFQAGQNYITGSNNISIGNDGSVGDSSTIRIGTFGTHTSAFMAGIQGTDLTATGTAVVVDASGRLGTTSAPIGYTDADAVAAVGPHYADADAIAAVGPHYTDSDASAAVGPHYTDADATAAIGAHTILDQPAVQALGFVTGAHYDDASAIAAVGPHYMDAQAVVAVGPHVILSDTNNNTAAGTSALDSLTTGTGNSGFGINALTSNTGGSENTALGHGTLFANIDGGQNVAVGYNALLSNTSGSSNTALGVDALNANTMGIVNTAVGRDALASNTTGDRNTAIGYQALISNTTGNTNTANGTSALENNATGGGNTAIGNAAMRNNTGGVANTAVGEGALFGNSTGSNNIALGREAGFFITTGFHNIAIGNAGASGDSGTIRIGDSDQTLTFIAGINGNDLTTTGTTVVVDSNGQLGTTTNSVSGHVRVSTLCIYNLGQADIQDCPTTCPAGKFVLSGGHDHNPSFYGYHDEVIVAKSFPPNDSSWLVRIINSNTDGGTRAGEIRAYAVCAD